MSKQKGNLEHRSSWLLPENIESPEERNSALLRHKIAKDILMNCKRVASSLLKGLLS